MATQTRRLEVVIVGDDKNLQKTFKSVDDGAGKMDKAFKGVATAVGSAFAVDAVVNFGGQLLDLSSQLTAIDTKTKTVFEGQAESVRKWADENNEAFGLTDDQLTGLAANFGDLLKPMGFTADQAATMSKDVVGLAGALSAWSGGTIDSAGAADILSKAMLGERDGLKQLGIAISEADVDARLAAKGQDELTGAALEQAKAVATQELIFEKSQDAQKAWANGSNDALKAQNELKASVGEMKERLATALVPAMLKAFQVGSKIVGWLMENKTAVLAVGAGIMAALVPAFIAWAAAAIPAAIATVAAAAPVIALGVAIGALAYLVVTHWDTIKNAFSTALEFIKGAVSGAINWIRSNWDLVLGILTGPVGLAVVAIRRHWDEIVGFITGLPGRITAAAAGMWDGIKNAFKSAINWIIDKWNSIEFTIGGWDPPGPGPSFPSVTIGTPNLPRLAEGGLVTQPILAMVGEAGPEAIIPLNRANMGGGNVTVHVHVNGSVVAGARDIMAAVEEGVRRGVRPGAGTVKAFSG